MRGPANDAAQMQRAGFLRMEGVGNIVLDEFARAPAGCVEEAIVNGKVDVGDEWGDGLEPLQEWRQHQCGKGCFPARIALL